METRIIKELCKQKGVTIHTLELESGVGRNNIARWENYTPGIDKVKAVADYFGVTVDYLLGSEPPENQLVLTEDLRRLLEVASKCSPNEVKTAIRLVQALRGEGVYDTPTTP